MDEGNENVNTTVRKAVRKFQRRKVRDRPSTPLIEKLKQTREAAGLPLNATHQTEDRKIQPAPEENVVEPRAESNVGRQNMHSKVAPQSPQGGHVIGKGKGLGSKSKPDDRPGSLNFPPTPSTVINVSPWQENATPVHTETVPDQGHAEAYRKTIGSYRSPVEPGWTERSGTGEPWQNNKTLAECNLYMFTYEIGCDVTFLVGESQEVVNAHSYVLNSRSAKFADILEDQKMLDNKLVAIPDVRLDTFKRLLRYFYTDEIELTVDSATALIPASSVYGPSSLKADCFYFLLSEINSDNVCITMELAHEFDEADVYKRCLNFIYVNAADVLRTSTFRQLCRDCIEEIVKSDDLNADEFNVFEALVMWANGECSRRRIQPNDRSRRQVLDKLLYYVRFAVMDVLEFTQKISHKEVLSQDEMIVLFQYFHGETHKLPPHFNTRRRHEYKIKNIILSKPNKKGRSLIELPNISPRQRSLVTPYKQNVESEDNLPVQRVIRFQGLNKDWQTTGSDAIGFRVSKPINLRGAQIFGPHYRHESYDVEITIYDDFKEVIRREKKTIVTQDNPKVYDVMLLNPVRMPEGRTFVVQISMREKPTYHGINGLDEIEMDGVTFQFFNSNRSINGTDVTIGQIPTILFNKLSDTVDMF